jgi:putative ABC transport system permease protein
MKNYRILKLTEWVVFRITDGAMCATIMEDLGYQFVQDRKEDGILAAFCRHAFRCFIIIPPLIVGNIVGGLAMFKNYIKIAFRNLIRHKMFSLINISGLAIGLSICMIISLWIQRELSYDRFHKNGHRIYRVERELFRDNLTSRWPITGGRYKDALISDFPEIENAVRFWRREFSIKDYNSFVHRQQLFAVDNSVFDIFDFSLEEGDPQSALTEPMTVVLTRENAFKYFGTEDVIDRSLTFEWNGEPVDFRVTGILREVPENSHVHFDMLMSISSYSEKPFTDWRSNYLFTYVLVSEKTSKSDLEEKLKTFVSRRLEAHYGDLLSQGFEIHEVLKMHLFPITDIHLHPSVNWELEAGGNVTSVYIFSSIAVLILIIACINFMNLSTARASRRAREVGLRKTVGAGINQLRGQFMQESVLFAAVAFVLALFLCALLIPAFNKIFTENLSPHLLWRAKNLIIFIGITLAVGFFAGLYPAFYLTRFDPTDVLQGGPRSGSGKSTFRRTMVIVQFSISVALIIGMFTIYQQMRYIQNRSLGFDRENVVLIPVRSRQVEQRFESMRNAFLSSSQILSVATSNDVPGETFYSNTNFISRERSDEPVLLIVLMADHNFVDTYRMDVLTGRNFSKAFSTDTMGTVILNEAAVRRFGWTPEEAVDNELSFMREARGKIVGVVKDFNYRSLHTEVEPMALLLNPDYIRTISVRIKPGDVGKTLHFLQKTWEETFPDEQFEYSFLDRRIHQLYEREDKMQNIFIVFSCFSIFVACLGLFGMAAFMTVQRTKETGIRKVLGASVGSVVLLLSKEFMRWVFLANFIGCPLAYFIMNHWLQDFAYRIELGLSVFLLPVLLTLFIAWITVSFHTIKSARANPIDSLRYE